MFEMLHRSLALYSRKIRNLILKDENDRLTFLPDISASSFVI